MIVIEARCGFIDCPLSTCFEMRGGAGRREVRGSLKADALLNDVIHTTETSSTSTPLLVGKTENKRDRLLQQWLIFIGIRSWSQVNQVTGHHYGRVCTE